MQTLVAPLGFSRASRTINSTVPGGSGGRPGLRGWVHFRVSSARCQRSNVSGVTRNDRHADRGSTRLSKAGSARSAGRYSTRFTWRRSTAT